MTLTVGQGILVTMVAGLVLFLWTTLIVKLSEWLESKYRIPATITGTAIALGVPLSIAILLTWNVSSK